MPADDPKPASPFAPEDKAIDLSDIQWSDAPVFLVFWALAIVVFLQFYTRYVLNDSYGWTEEVARFLLIAVTFIGSIMAARKQSHIAVELLYRYLSRPLRYAMQLFVDVVSLAFFAFMAWFCVELAQRTRGLMVAVDVPKALVYWVVAVCFVLMALYAVAALVGHVRSGTSRLIDPERFTALGPSI